MTAPELFTTFPDVQFYDYTKNWGRYLRWLLNTRGQNDGLYSWPRNYHLTMSAGATWQDDGIAAALRYGGTLAVVFHKVPETYRGFPVIDGDLHDARWLDPQGVIVGLKAKGKAKGNGNGFVKG